MIVKDFARPFGDKTLRELMERYSAFYKGMGR